MRPQQMVVMLVMVSALAWAGGPAIAAPACPALLQQRLPRLQDERPIDLCGFAGKVVVVVNTASQCGYTPQYQALEALYQRYAARGLVVLGFPSNDFGSQEPGSNSQIAEFCENQFAVKFPMFAKSAVRAGSRDGPPNALYRALAGRTGKPPQWNFHKYIVARDGEIVISHPGEMEPLDPKFVRDVEHLLAVR